MIRNDIAKWLQNTTYNDFHGCIGERVVGQEQLADLTLLVYCYLRGVAARLRAIWSLRRLPAQEQKRADCRGESRNGDARRQGRAPGPGGADIATASTIV